MILVTGACGKTGRAILNQLRARGAAARGLVHRPTDVEAALQAGASEALPGDFLSPTALDAALRGIDTVYHICPNMHPQEVEIARGVISAAQRAGVRRLVYHSVLHPQTSGMSHHWNKLRAEELLFELGLAFTILQPCAYMQNIQGYWKAVTETGVYALPYAVETCISVVDLEDVAEAAARVLTGEEHAHAIYELAGPQALTQVETARLLAAALGREVRAEQIQRADWERQARGAGMAEYAVQTLLAMFAYYEQFGFVGNAKVLTWLLGRPANTFSHYIQRLGAGGFPHGS